MDTAAAIHMIYNLRLYINTDLDPSQKWSETVNSFKISLQSAGIVTLKMLLDGKSTYVYFYYVYYCPELDFNLLSLKILEKKRFRFVGKQGFFYVINNEKDTILEAKWQGIIYSLL